MKIFYLKWVVKASIGPLFNFLKNVKLKWKSITGKHNASQQYESQLILGIGIAIKSVIGRHNAQRDNTQHKNKNATQHNYPQHNDSQCFMVGVVYVIVSIKSIMLSAVMLWHDAERHYPDCRGLCDGTQSKQDVLYINLPIHYLDHWISSIFIDIYGKCYICISIGVTANVCTKSEQANIVL